MKKKLYRPESNVPRLPTTGLHFCTCGSDLVQPVEWAEYGPTAWCLVLRCPECENRRTVVASQSLVEDFDEAMDRGDEQILTDLRKLTRANMRSEIDRFAEALQAGAIVPEDF